MKRMMINYLEHEFEIQPSELESMGKQQLFDVFVAWVSGRAYRAGEDGALDEIQDAIDAIREGDDELN